ncbi:MAG TPA: hypothetical protein P5084_06800 [Paludibacter sp.]|nr:hypothetical protein [Paludibacter sp.]
MKVSIKNNQKFQSKYSFHFIMLHRFKTILIFILLLLFFCTNTINAQLFNDLKTVNLIKKNVDCVYNQQFNEAQSIYLKIQKSYPGHPALYLLKGLQTYWTNYPMIITTPERSSFESDLRKCIQLSEKNKDQKYVAEYLQYNLCARGMLLKFYDDNSLTKDVIPLVTSSYSLLTLSFKFTQDYTDLYYFTGVYNYYREAYPNAHPIYKSLLFLFPHGDMKKGLLELQNAAVNAVVLRAESYYLLSWINSNFENNYPQAIKYSKLLHDLYPNNLLYTATYIKNLLLIKQYNEAENQIEVSQKFAVNKYFQTQLIIFRGILQEKKYHDINKAYQYYTIGMNSIKTYGDYGNEYAAYAYFGLSRISYSKGDKNAGRQFREKAKKLTASEEINFDK